MSLPRVRASSLPAEPTQTQGPGRLTPWDLAGILAGVLLTLAVTCINSRGRILWEDEMLGWMLLRDPSWRHMVDAWRLGADGGGFSFYLLGRLWFALAGASALSFRLFTSTCFAVGFAATWISLRRFYPTGIVAFALCNTWFFSPPFIFHLTEGRFYGLLVLSTSLALWLALLPPYNSGAEPLWIYPATFLVHGLLTTSHLLGVVFSGFILLGIVALDVLEGRTRWRLYLSAAASWLLLLPERAAILASAQVGKPHFWTKPPTLRTLLGVYSGFSAEIAIVLLLLCAGALLTLWRSPGGPSSGLDHAIRARRPVYVLAGCLLLAPIAFLVESLIATPLLNDRYLLPITVALAYATAELLQLCNPSGLFRRLRPPALASTLRWTVAAGYAAALLLWAFVHLARFTPAPHDYTGALTAQLPKDVPVLCENAFVFTELIGRQHASGVLYTYLLDWPQSIRPGAPRLESMQYHLMENWKKSGYFSKSIVDAEPFLSQHNRFLILQSTWNDPSLPTVVGNQLAERLSHNPAYQVRPFAAYTREGVHDTVWLVCRGVCPAP